MNAKDRNQQLKNLLAANAQLLGKAAATFLLSHEECKQIGLRNQYDYEELKAFDSFTSKFARTSDLLTQKALRNLFAYFRETTGTFIDLANRAEKIGCIASADRLLEIRDLRNQIAHEYLEEKLTALFGEALDLSEPLLQSVRLTQQYIENLK